MAGPYETGSESLRDRVSKFHFILVGKLRFLADRTRPDLQYVMSRLGSVMSNPSEEAYIELMRTLRYIKGNKQFKACYRW